MSAHTALEEERRPQLGHAVDEIELRAVAAFLGRRAAEMPTDRHRRGDRG